MVPVITQIIKDVKEEDQASGDTDGKPDDVDKAIG
jgi:hypothetical protein